MRIGIDGERGFCYGVDDEWRPRSSPFISAARKRDSPAKGQTQNFFSMSSEAKQESFHDSVAWKDLQVSTQPCCT